MSPWLSSAFGSNARTMSLSASPKVWAGRFTIHRAAHLLSVLSFGMVPFHFIVSCQASRVVAAIAMLLLIATVLLCFLTPRGTTIRFLPTWFASVAMLAHGLCTH
jgi:hypothetical protein